MPTINSKTENHTTFKLREEVTHVSSNWHSNRRRGAYPVSICRIYLFSSIVQSVAPPGEWKVT